MLISVSVLGTTTEGLPGRRSLVEGHSKLGHIGRKLGDRPGDPTTRDCCFSERAGSLVRRRRFGGGIGGLREDDLVRCARLTGREMMRFQRSLAGCSHGIRFEGSGTEG